MTAAVNVIWSGVSAFGCGCKSQLHRLAPALGDNAAQASCGPGSLLGCRERGRGLAQPSDNPTLRLPGATLTFNEREIEGNGTRCAYSPQRKLFNGGMQRVDHADTLHHKGRSPKRAPPSVG